MPKLLVIYNLILHNFLLHNLLQPNTPAARVGSQPFSVTSANGRFTDWFQWQQVALFASAHPLRCLAGSRTEEEEEVACGASDGSIYLLRLMLPGDF
jgi:hypothetical protein